MSIYLDNNATTQPLPEVVEVVARMLTDAWGNPSSDHCLGSKARKVLGDSREVLGASLGVDAQCVVFTSGGTEANERALALALASESFFACSSVEHSSVMKIAERFETSGGEVAKIEVDENGQLSMEELLRVLELGCRVVSVQWVNSETGVVQNIESISGLCQEFGAILHVDAAQALGRFSMSPELLGEIDFLTFTGHKLHAPKGVGAMILGVAQKGRFDEAGGQEGGLRSGTENLPGIAGMAVGLKQRMGRLEESLSYLEKLRDRFESQLLIGDLGLRINGANSIRVPNTSNVFFPGIQGEALVKRLDLEDVACSQMSACLMGRPEPSYVLTAMNVPEGEAYASVRFAFSVMNTLEEVDQAANIIKNNYLKMLQQNNLLAS